MHLVDISISFDVDNAKMDEHILNTSIEYNVWNVIAVNTQLWNKVEID